MKKIKQRDLNKTLA